jgi:hypothetical protein
LDSLYADMNNWGKAAYDTAMEVRGTFGSNIHQANKSLYYAERVDQIYHLAYELHHALVGFDDKSGLLTAGNPTVLELLSNAVQPKDRQTIIDFMDYSLRFRDGLQTLQKTEADPEIRKLLFENVLSLLSGQAYYFNDATDKLGALIQKTNSRVAEIKHGL